MIDVARGAGGYWGMGGRMRRGYFWVLKNTLNRLTLRMARAGVGPFSVLRHTGRKSGKTFEVPLILGETSDGDLVAELTYGAEVNWLRNLEAGGDALVVRGRRRWRIVGVENLGAEAGLRAFGNPAAGILKLLGKSDFRLLRVAR
ncbi:nitroreductase family deazaflavin-dependent oxidoreductase [Herbiconiux sp. UC225_62]|uniref:nitroreductase family deazaflavin-dependent oxidoreductase n=1 Tax=Herbiconiux sp. UC225_62 TaxID=3350168 RepID=UPI0036D21B34